MEKWEFSSDVYYHGNIIVFVPQGSLQNVKLVFDKEIEELLNNTSCPSPSGGEKQQFLAGKLFSIVKF